MQPYQQASEESTKQSYRPFQAASTLALPALKAGIGGKIMSVLNKYVPADLALKGLSKIDPRLGKFANLAQESGHSYDDIKDFIGSKIEEAPTKEDRNLIEQESPELFQFLDQEIKKGRKPVEAGALAQNDKKFTSIIKKLMERHKTPWSSIIESIFGEGAGKSNSKQEALGKYREHQKQSMMQGEMERFQNQYGQQQQQPQGGNPQAKEQLLQAMQALSQKLRT